MVRIKNSERWRQGIEPPLPILSIEVDPCVYMGITNRVINWYLYQLDKNESGKNELDLTCNVYFIKSGSQAWINRITSVYKVQRGDLTRLLQITDATKELNDGENCSSEELASSFEEGAGDDVFWGWCLIKVN